MSNVDNWAWANGLYMQDDSLATCDSSGRPRYRQIGGNGTLWPKNKFWRCSTTVCGNKLLVKQFGTSNTNAATPDLVMAGKWRMTMPRRDGAIDHPSLAVSAVPAGECGKPIVTFIACK